MRQEPLPSMRKELSLINHREGFSIVEVMLAGSVFVLLVTALVGAYLYGQESTALAGNRARATLLAEEGMEATRNIRDAGFNNLTDGTHGLSVTGNEWNLFGSSDTTDIFTRIITIATVDTKRKNVTSQVTWQQNPQRNGSVTLVSRFTNWIASGIGDWVHATTTSSVDLSGNNNGLKVALSSNYAFIIRSGGSPDFVILDISNPSSPSQTGSLDLTGTLVNIAVSGNYAYVTSNNNSAELQIIDISNPSSPNLTGTYNATGNTDGSGIFVSDTTAYLGRSDNGSTDEFLVINISNPSNPSLVGSLNTSGDANEITVLGNYAYIASGNNVQELQIVNIATPSNPILSGSYDLSSNTDALTIAGFGSTIVIGQGTTLYTINISTPSSPAILGSINTQGTVNDINLGNSNMYVFTADSNNSKEFQVIDISALANPSELSNINIPGNNGLFGIVYDSVNDRVYAVSNTDNQEFFVFSPQ